MAPSPDKPTAEQAAPLMHRLTSGTAGVGLVLIGFPMGMLFFGAPMLEGQRLVGLPLVSIFGIMILFGTLALVAMLFRTLGLHDPTQPLALPEGSIRAAIALSLIVLFAIISIMLFQSAAGQVYVLDSVNADLRNELVSKTPSRVVLVADAPCAASVPAGGGCSPADRRYAVHLRPGASSESNDLGKQLLVLVGTLMTSVTSYYFAARGAIAKADAGAGAGAGAGGAGDAPAAGAAPATPPVAPAAPAAELAEAHVDGCDVPITDATRDEDLPPARGGVAAGGM